MLGSSISADAGSLHSNSYYGEGRQSVCKKGNVENLLLWLLCDGHVQIKGVISELLPSPSS